MDIDTDAVPSAPLARKTIFSVRGNPFRVDSRYSILKPLGLGAYGFVCAASDSYSKNRVAIKKVANVFDDLTDAKRIIREIRLLRALQHENIIGIVGMDEPENYSKFNDVYIITDLMDTDLQKFLVSSAQLMDSQRKYFVYHMLRALKYIHSANIIHRDLKPANILVSVNCDIKICDFGLARFFDPVESASQDMTEYVVTRWYRAPELLLAYDDYTCAIDMWSVGCILAELYGRRPVFPGSDVKRQLGLICGVLGKPTEAEVRNIPNQRAREFVMSLPSTEKMGLKKFMSGADASALDLAERLLQFDAGKRLSATQALEHPFVKDYRDVKTERVMKDLDTKTLEPPSERLLGKDGVRHLMWNEIVEFNPSARGREPAAAKEAQQKVDKIVGRT